MANVKVGLYVRLTAKPGKEAELQKFLAGALPLANAESGTTVWFAIKYSANTFAIFDAFADETGRKAHLTGDIAKALMAKAGELLASPPNIEQVEVMAAKIPG
ncbi:MAG TPA: antibiotic biosynthesis monooxygenase [Myxococcales bacterium]